MTWSVLSMSHQAFQKIVLKEQSDGNFNFVSLHTKYNGIVIKIQMYTQSNLISYTYCASKAVDML